jgi:hypothetical protein
MIKKLLSFFRRDKTEEEDVDIGVLKEGCVASVRYSINPDGSIIVDTELISDEEEYILYLAELLHSVQSDETFEGTIDIISKGFKESNNEAGFQLLVDLLMNYCIQEFKDQAELDEQPLISPSDVLKDDDG